MQMIPMANRLSNNPQHRGWALISRSLATEPAASILHSRGCSTHSRRQ